MTKESAADMEAALQELIETAQGNGIRHACNILGKWLNEEPAWLRHVVDSSSNCGCDFDQCCYTTTYCDVWTERQDELFQQHHGLTREEWKKHQEHLLAVQREAQAAKERKTVEQRDAERRQLAEEQGIDPRLLP